MYVLANSETQALTATKDMPAFVTEEMRNFYASSGQAQGSTVATALVPLEVVRRKTLKQKKIIAHVFWVPGVRVLSPA